MLWKISNKSPNPDPSMHPKLNKGSFLKNRSSCIASILGLNHGSRSAISSLSALGYRGAQWRLRTPLPLSTPPLELLGIPLLLPPGSPTEGYFNIKTVELCHWTQAVFISLKSYNMNGSRCLMIWFGGIEDISLNTMLKRDYIVSALITTELVQGTTG